MNKRAVPLSARVTGTGTVRVRRTAGWLLVVTLSAALVGPQPGPARAAPMTPEADAAPSAVATVTPAAETAPVAHEGYATMGAGVWSHPRDGALSLVIGVDRQGSVEVYDLAGRLRQRVAAAEPWDIDVLGDVVAVTDQTAAPTGLIRFYTVDRAKRTLRSAGTVDTALAERGVCLYRGRGGPLYLFATTESGRVAQYALGHARGGAITARLVRGPWEVGGSTEGCTVDQARGMLYLAEELTAIWAYGAQPSASTTARTEIDVADDEWLVGDIEGLAFTGRWLVASSQGDSTFVVYDAVSRTPRRKVAVVAGPRADACAGSHGIEAVAGSMGRQFPHGVFVCQDGSNGLPAPGNANFKLVPLERVLP